MKKQMQSRYTVKKYLPKKLNNLVIEDLKEVLRLSPSSINSQPWNFVFVEDEEEKKKFAKVSMHNKEKIENASCLIIFRAKTVEFFEQEMNEYLPERAQDYYHKFLKPLEIKVREAWIDRQIYLALGVLLTTCAAENIDSTPMEGIDTKEYDKILDDTNYRTVVAATVGVADPEDYNRLSENPKQRLPKNKVITTL